MYRSGDLGRFRHDGRIAFLGRRDRQVQVRGFRVEPGEIEAVLRRHPAIRGAVVEPRGARGSDRLAAYLAGERSELDVEQVRAFLAALLPAYMVPNEFVLLDEIPVLSSGKVDRRALSAIPLDVEAAGHPAAPRSDLEETVAGLCRELLGVETLGVHQDLGSLGANSLTVTRLLARLRETFGVDLRAARVLERPTVAGISASVVEAMLAQADPEVAARALSEVDAVES